MSTFEAHTASLTARTASLGRGNNRTALAARSLSAANRLSGDARRKALHEHFERFTPAIFSARPRG